MLHCEADDLALDALGEPLPPRHTAHVAGCGPCSEQARAFAAVVAAVRVRIPDGPDVAPPPLVWARIAEQTGVSATPASVPVLRPRKAAASRSWGVRSLLAVAAAALVVGGAGGSLLARTSSGGDATPATPDGGTVVAAALAGLPLAPGAQGGARVVVTSSGTRDLVVDVSRLDARTGSYYEVWLIDASVRRMVPLGVLQGGEGRFTIPAGVDLGEYPLVDVSVQRPGSPEHSGESVLRGTLPA